MSKLSPGLFSSIDSVVKIHNSAHNVSSGNKLPLDSDGRPILDAFYGLHLKRLNSNIAHLWINFLNEQKTKFVPENYIIDGEVDKIKLQSHGDKLYSVLSSTVHPSILCYNLSSVKDRYFQLNIFEHIYDQDKNLKNIELVEKDIDKIIKRYDYLKDNLSYFIEPISQDFKGLDSIIETYDIVEMYGVFAETIIELITGMGEIENLIDTIEKENTLLEGRKNDFLQILSGYLGFISNEPIDSIDKGFQVLIEHRNSILESIIKDHDNGIFNYNSKDDLLLHRLKGMLSNIYDFTGSDNLSVSFGYNTLSEDINFIDQIIHFNGKRSRLSL